MKLLLGVLASACTAVHVAAPPPASRAPIDPPRTGLLWRFDPHAYLSEGSFVESYYSPQLVLLHNRKAFGGELVAIDGKTGEARWHHAANWVVHPPDRAEPLWIVDDPANQDHREIIRLDARTGRELDRIPLEEPMGYLDERLAWADDKILAFGYHTLRAVDPWTGRTRWSAPVSSYAYLRAPVVANGTVVVQDGTYVALDLETGAVRWSIAGACCTAIASPDGRELYLRGKGDDTLRVDWSGRVRGVLAGDLRAVSDDHVAIQEPHRLAVYRHGEGRPMWTLPIEQVGAVALAGDTLFYFADRTLWRRDLTTGRAEPITTPEDQLVISPDAVGVAKGNISTPPVWTPPYLFVDNRGVEAYGVP